MWLRRDLRLNDNAALYHALKNSSEVTCLFIFDRNILDDLEDREDARVQFLHDTLLKLKAELRALGSDLIVKYGYPKEVWKDLVEEEDFEAVYANRDYEPYAKDRDQEILEILASNGKQFNSSKDHIIFESGEVLKDDGDPYVVFTPYKRKWLARLDSKVWKGTSYFLTPYPCKKYFSSFKNSSNHYDVPSLESMGFSKSSAVIPKEEVPQSIIKKYDENRNFPAVEGTSKLGIHFRFGTISIREKAMKARRLNDTYLSELVWRDFYSQILDHFPKVVNNAFRDKYDRIPWLQDEEAFNKWKEGKTGYPIVDAGMRELNATGFMHNRVRMITASFLTKHLLQDWRKGEAYFAEKLLDFDLASNNGGWQWAAGSGTDAAPYFRIFNPTSQMQKFDKDKAYIKQWVPEYGTDAYPDPIVDHKEARERCLATYKLALNNN